MKRKLPDKETITRLYWKENKSASEIASLYGTARVTVFDFMRRHNIPRRSKKEAIRLCLQQNKRRKRPLKVSKLKNVVRCRKCFWVFKTTKEKIKENCPNCGNLIDIRDRKEWYLGYLKKHPERLESLKNWKKLYGNKYKNKSGKNLRKSVLFVVGGKEPKCVYCGCNDIRLLEVNHKLGGRTKERSEKGAKFYWEIIKLKRKTDDLKITCRVCNALHYLELKYGKLPFKITYQSNNSR